MYRYTLSIVGVLSIVGCADVDPNGAMEANETPATTQQHLSPVATTRPVVGPVVGPIKPPRWTFTNTIDFDTDPNGAAVAAGTDVSNTYATMGVTFRATLCDPNCHSTPVYSNRFGSNGNNVVALTATGYPGYDNSLGAIETWFSFPIIGASIEVTSELTPESLNQTPTARPWLEAYDTSGNYLGKTYGTASPGVKQTLSVSYSNIGHLRFGSQRTYPWMYGIFDNLSYTFRLTSIAQP